MMPTLHDGDIVLVDLGRRAPTPPGIFVLHDGMRLVAKRLEHIPNNDPPRVRIISDNPLYKPYEGGGEEVNIIGRIRWFAREM
jgi:phage repressor protein C with HTH and peptisase S24 domain